MVWPFKKKVEPEPRKSSNKNIPAQSDQRKSLFKGKSGDSDAKKNRHSESSKNFPCCFYIPLDIAMQGFAVIDIIFYVACACGCGLGLTKEPFAGRSATAIVRNRTLGLEYLGVLDEMLSMEKGLESLEHGHNSRVDYEELFSETSTTLGPIIYDPEEYDNEKMAREYSRIAYYLKNYDQEIDDGCGRDYYQDYLFTHELTVTKALFEDIMYTVITASVMYAVCGAVMLTVICCFRGYVYSKLLIIILWYSQLLPSYYIIEAGIKSQSHRLCIFEYGFGKNYRPLRTFSILLVLPLVLYKPYELFIWSNYIRKYFHNKDGKLVDESYFSKAKAAEWGHGTILGALHPETDLTRHHYAHYVGQKPLFKQPYTSFGETPFSRPKLTRFEETRHSPDHSNSSSD